MNEAKVCLLLVGSDSDYARSVQSALAQSKMGRQYDIEHVASLTEGLDRLAHHTPDVALVDLALPGGDQESVVEKIRAHAAQVPLVVVAAEGEVAVALEWLQEGAQDYLPKACFDGEELEATILKAMERHHWRAQLTATNRQLRNREQTLRCAIEAGNLVAWDWDRMQDTVTLTEALPGSEHDSQTLPAADLRRLVHPKHQAAVEGALEQALATGQGYRLEYQVILPNGETRWIADHGMPVEQSTRVVGITHDITERKETERQRALDQKFQNAILDALTKQLVVLGGAGRIFMVNQAWRHFIDEHAVEIGNYGLGSRYIDICGAVINCDISTKLAVDGIQQLWDGLRSSFELEYPHHFQGKTRWFKLCASQFEWEGARHIAISHDDVTQRRKAEEALRKSEARFQRAVAGALDGIWDWELSSGALWISPRTWTMINGCAAPSPTHVDAYWELIHPEDRPRLEGEIRAHLAGATPACDADFRMRTITGDYRWYRTRGTASHDEEGKPTHLSGALEEITEEVEVQSKLHQLAAIIHSSADAILSTSLDGEVLTWNRAAERIYGYAADEIVGTNISTLLPESKAGEYEAMVAELIQGAQSSQRNTVRRTKSGKEIEMSLLLSPICDCSGKLIAISGIHRDMTEVSATRRALEDRELQIRQKQKLEAVGSLAGGIAHEFNNLLQAILGYTRFAMEDMEQDDPRAEDLTLVVSAAERASTLTRQLLRFGRRDEVRKAIVSPHDIVNSLVKLLRPLIGEHIELEVGLDAPSSAVIADAGLIDQMLMNLCLNARDALGSGGKLKVEAKSIELSETLITRWSQIDPGCYVQFVVEDDGHGMTDDILERVFEPFFTTKPIGEGTGLGLPMVYGVIQQHNGSLDIISAPGQGTRFEVNLPAVEAADSPDEFLPETIGMAGAGVVLIAEDEPLVRDVARRVLRRAGYQVITACDGNEAIELLYDYPGNITLAVLDMVMPKRTGREVYAALKAARNGTKAIFCSGYAAEPDFGEFLVNEHVPLLQKPFKPEALLNMIEHTLRGEPCLGR